MDLIVRVSYPKFLFWSAAVYRRITLQQGPDTLSNASLKEPLAKLGKGANLEKQMYFKGGGKNVKSAFLAIWKISLIPRRMRVGSLGDFLVVPDQRTGSWVWKIVCRPSISGRLISFVDTTSKEHKTKLQLRNQVCKEYIEKEHSVSGALRRKKTFDVFGSDGMA